MADMCVTFFQIVVGDNKFVVGPTLSHSLLSSFPLPSSSNPHPYLHFPFFIGIQRYNSKENLEFNDEFVSKNQFYGTLDNDYQKYWYG